MVDLPTTALGGSVRERAGVAAQRRRPQQCHPDHPDRLDNPDRLDIPDRLDQVWTSRERAAAAAGSVGPRACPAEGGHVREDLDEG
jgi:hypothetical protein